MDHYDEGMQLIAFLRWFVWKSRNCWVSQGRNDDPVEVWKVVEAVFCEFVLSFHVVVSMNNNVWRNDQQWTPHPIVVVKMNCDASYVASLGNACVATIIWDEQGLIVDATRLLKSFLLLLLAMPVWFTD
ncbi:hypothetical protein V6N11_058961 [Hibiscus sabdariffa]|uniref:RNase H type-1 domain-containing protein n=1 Tax=Hibiscus sabdariffa TaxID=183260 RepID=A0ABR2U5Q3_9ROSI